MRNNDYAKYSCGVNSFRTLPKEGQCYLINSEVGPLTYFVLDSYNDPLARALKEEKPTILSEAFNYIHFLNLSMKNYIMLDIGANLGIYSLPFAKNGYEVVAFEANRQNCTQIRASIEKNNLNVSVIEKAVTETSGTYRFVEAGPYGHLENSFLNDNSSASIIEGTSIDDWYASADCKGRIRAIKIDIEGGELDAIKGMKNLIVAENHPLIYMEINTWCLAWNNITAKHIWDEIKSVGYWPYRMVSIDILEKLSPDADIQQSVVMNYMMINDNDEILKRKTVISQQSDIDDSFFSKGIASTNPCETYAVAYTILQHPRLLKHKEMERFAEKLSNQNDDMNKKICEEIYRELF